MRHASECFYVCQGFHYSNRLLNFVMFLLPLMYSFRPLFLLSHLFKSTTQQKPLERRNPPPHTHTQMKFRGHVAPNFETLKVAKRTPDSSEHSGKEKVGTLFSSLVIVNLWSVKVTRTKLTRTEVFYHNHALKNQLGLVMPTSLLFLALCS